MKVGFLSASLSRNAGGLYDATRLLARELWCLPGFEVEVFGLEDAYTGQDMAGWAGLSVRVHQTLGPRSLGYAPGLRQELDRAELNLLHSHGLWMYPSHVSLSWAKSLGVPYVISPHGMLDPWAVNNSRWKKRLAGRLYEDAHLKGASCIHALCDAERYAIRAYGLRNPVCVIPNGVFLANGDAGADPEWQQLLPEHARVLLYLGRIHPKKGLENLLRAWKASQNRASTTETWCLVIAGWDQGGHEAELKTLAASLSITESVFFVGPQFDAAKQASYANADAFVLPSFSEGLPMVVLEAWAYGLPVVMTRQCNLPEGFAVGAALEVETNVDAISAGLVALLGLSANERMAMGGRGRLLVEERFTWTRIAEQMASVYRWVLTNGTKPDCVFLD